MSRTYVVWNPKSGKAEVAAPIREQLELRPDTTVRETKEGSDAADFAREAVEQGYDLIVAAGGDGTVNSVANGIAEGKGRAAMAVLPIGTANDFAHTLAIPDELEAAADLLFTGAQYPIDLVELETKSERRCFANVAAGGNSNRVTESLTDDIKRTWGPLCYLRGAVGILADLGSYQATVRFDEEEPFELSLWNVLVANGRTNAGRLAVAPTARPDDGLFDVILIRDGTLVDLAALAARFALSSGAYLESEQIIHRQVRSFSLTSTPPMLFTIDGEAVEEEPTAFRIKPAALRMVVGETFGDVPAVWG